MLLAINIGNTNITSGIFNEEKLQVFFKTPVKSKNLEKIFREKHREFSGINGVIIGSVVPHMTPLIIEVLKKLLLPSPLVVNSEMNLSVKFKVDYPDKVGPDLISNMVAAHKFYKKRLMIIDSGTATTFCMLSKNADFTGSIISPGLELMSKSLTENTAQLPRISSKRPDVLIGKNTIEAMQSGIYWGYIDLVQGMIKRLKNQVGEGLIIGTGGNMELIVNDLNGIDVINSDLTLEGLRIIYELNI